jgi:hypothetical protein
MKTRPMPVIPEPERCVFCDRYMDQWHHVAGRHHCGWFVVPLCIFHHRIVTKAEDAAGIKRNPADNQKERIQRARQQCLVFLWLLDSPEMKQ